MKKFILSLAIAMYGHCSYAQWTTNQATNDAYNTNASGKVGIGTSTPQASLDVGKMLGYGEMGSILARLPEGTGSGTTLGVRAFDTQLSHGVTDWSNIKSFALEHSFYGNVNNSINFYRGSSYTGGSIGFNTNDNTERMRILYNGNVGIGTTNPTAKLYVAGGGRNGLKIDDSLDGTPASKYLSFWQGTGAAGIDPIGTGVIYLGYDQSSDIMFGGSSSNGVWKANGNVLIGQTTQVNPAYKLDVKGSARANEIVVNTTGADFVFDKQYLLPKLSDVKAYIDKNQHLPEIPSAKEMQTNGMSVGEINTKLLQKVEELTLYLIEKNKEVEDLQTKVTQLEKQQVKSRQQEARIAALEKAMLKQPRKHSK